MTKRSRLMMSSFDIVNGKVVDTTEPEVCPKSPESDLCLSPTDLSIGFVYDDSPFTFGDEEEDKHSLSDVFSVDDDDLLSLSTSSYPPTPIKRKVNQGYLSKKREYWMMIAPIVQRMIEDMPVELACTSLDPVETLLTNLKEINMMREAESYVYETFKYYGIDPETSTLEEVAPVIEHLFNTRTPDIPFACIEFVIEDIQKNITDRAFLFCNETI